MSLKELYAKEVAPKLKEEFGYKNNMAIPKISKVVINVGVGRFSKEKAYIDNVVETVKKITGQQPVQTKAKKSISAFKVREGMVVGVVVTLRGQRMYDFTEKLINVTLPRVRDFRGLDMKSVDRSGNLTIGLKEHIAFPEVGADDFDKIHGLEICLTTTAETNEKGLALFKLLGFPFKKEAKSNK
ncbi:MAG: 50S ribosomal protein L5 [bacterium]|nr:50S ribosomal protein L5 [bacterium]